jgi:hypothetical protein
VKKVLFIRLVGHNGGLVIAQADRAQLVAQINHAIKSSNTWAEFRKGVPAKEYSSVVRVFDDNGEQRPADEDAFDAESLPGWSDGDYPPWLQSEMDRFLPRVFLAQYGTLRNTATGGSYWHIPECNRAAVVAALSAEGWTVVDADELELH